MLKLFWVCSFVVLIGLPLKTTGSADCHWLTNLGLTQAIKNNKNFINFPIEKEEAAPSEAETEIPEANTEEPETKTEAPETKDEEQETRAYSAMGDGYVVVSDGSSWYYEVLNDVGRVTSKRWYEAAKLVREISFAYDNGRLVSSKETSDGAVVEYFYDEAEREIRKVESLDGAGVTTETVYNERGLKAEVVITRQRPSPLAPGVPSRTRERRVFFYSANMLTREELYQDSLLTLTIDYRDKTKLVTIYDNGAPIKELEEAL